MHREVIERAIAGDTLAFRDLVEELQSFAFSVAFRMVGETGEAEDITQEAFIRLWKHLPKYRFDIKLTTWLYSIVTNLSLDYLRSRRRKERLRSGSVELSHALHEPTAPDAGIDIEGIRKVIERKMEELTPKQKVAFVLRDLEGLPVAEVCKLLAMSPDQLKSNLYHARAKMSEWLKSHLQTPKKVIS